MIRRFLKTNNHKTNLRRFFSMSPDPKFFLLRFRIKSEEEKPRPENTVKMMEELFDHLKPYEEKRIVQIAAKNMTGSESVMIFQSENETIPYQFLLSSPLYIGGYVDKFRIEELDIRADIGSGELARVFTYLATA